MVFESIPSVGLFMEVEDTHGRIHSLLVRTITACSDADEHGTETIIRSGGLQIEIGRPRKEVMDGIRAAAAQANGY